MIMIYSPSNNNYENNGDGIINAIQCKATFNIDGNWSIYLESPIDENLKYLQQQSVISVDTPYGKKQLYRICNHDKNDSTISINALPIFFDSRKDCMLTDIRPTDKNGQQALDIMMQGTKYSGRSDIDKISTSYYVYKNLMEALNGTEENSFINRWGGELAFENYTVLINKRIGEDRGLRAEFGFNINGINENVDWSSITTRIIPKAYNGYLLPNNETVDSKLINNYPIVYTKVIEYQDIKLAEDAQEDDAENGITVCDTLNDLYAALRTRAHKEFENGIDLPSITYDVDMVDLSRTDLYKDYNDLLKVNLGDTVHIKHRRLGIETSARVITLTYDCIAQKVENLVLGDYEQNYFNDVSSITHSVSQVINQSNNTLMADRIAGVLNLLHTSLRAQKDIAQKQDVRAILFEDLDPDSPNFGALCIGTQGLDIAKERNETNTDWLWGTAINFNSINADYMITGILTDRNGKFYLNLDTGELRMKDGSFIGNITGGTININNIFVVDSNGKVTIKANADINGKITSDSGKIGGWNINSEGLYNGVVKIQNNGLTNIYTWGDLAVMQMAIMGTISPNDAMIEHYDFNGDGSITSADYVILRNKLSSL